MGDFTVPNEEQAALCQETGVDPDQFMVILENDTTLCLLHIKTRNEVSVHKNRRITKKSGTPTDQS